MNIKKRVYKVCSFPLLDTTLFLLGRSISWVLHDQYPNGNWNKTSILNFICTFLVQIFVNFVYLKEECRFLHSVCCVLIFRTWKVWMIYNKTVREGNMNTSWYWLVKIMTFCHSCDFYYFYKYRILCVHSEHGTQHTGSFFLFLNVRKVVTFLLLKLTRQQCWNLLQT